MDQKDTLKYFSRIGVFKHRFLNYQLLCPMILQFLQVFYLAFMNNYSLWQTYNYFIPYIISISILKYYKALFLRIGISKINPPEHAKINTFLKRKWNDFLQKFSSPSSHTHTCTHTNTLTYIYQEPSGTYFISLHATKKGWSLPKVWWFRIIAGSQKK